METREYTDEEYESLQTSEREIAGNREQATISDVTVHSDVARIELTFGWRSRGQTLTFDLEQERDVLELKSLAIERGYDYEHLPYLEGETVEVVYLDGRWVPASTLPDEGSEALSGENTNSPGIVERAYRRTANWASDLTTAQLVLGAIIFKKILIAVAIVLLVL